MAGLLHPNDHVDVIATFQVPSEVESGFDGGSGRAEISKKLGSGHSRYALKTVTVTLLQNVTVLAIGTITRGGGLLLPRPSSRMANSATATRPATRT